MKKYIEKEDLENIKGVWLISAIEFTYYIRLGDDLLLIKRIGKCSPDKCKSICCKSFFYGGSSKDYVNGFMNKAEHGYYINKICRYLKKNRCSRWKKKGFPLPCLMFPEFMDKYYWHIMDKCTFKYGVFEEKKNYFKKDILHCLIRFFNNPLEGRSNLIQV